MNSKEIIKELSLKEKIELTSGKDFWHTKTTHGLKAIKMSDGPHGLRCQDDQTDMLGINKSLPATCFPTASITACSFDEELIKEMASAIALEAINYNVSIVLGPGTNIKRDPLCGRNFEYFSEDPYLAGKLSTAFIEAVQNKGVSTSLKHFALNNQEYKRLNSDSLVDERTMREIYLKPFEIAVKSSKPDTIMCSYNLINGVHSSDNKKLLTDILRDEWGYQGLVVTDWGAMNDRVAASIAGCDLNMPGGSDYMEKEMEEAVNNGTLPISCLDKNVERVLDLIIKHQEEKHTEVDFEKHHGLAVKIAENSMVLLKNEDNILPLKDKEDLVLIGKMAETPRYQGAGSSHINPTKITSLKDMLKDVPLADGYLADGSTNKELIAEAKNFASQHKIVILSIGLSDNYESEGFDRDDLKLPEGHLKLVEEVLKVNKNIIVVLSSGSVVELPFKDRVKAILYTGLAGQGIGEATYNILFGITNPSGKLAETWPIKYEDAVTSNDYRNNKNPKYKEGIYVGYRYYDSALVDVAYPFGYGLSYSSFEYKNLNISDNKISFDVTNISNIDGYEIVELYIENPKDGIYRPIKELKGFKKVFIKAHETVNVKFNIEDYFFEVYDDGFKKVAGTYKILISSSSKDINLKQTIEVEGVELETPTHLRNTFYDLVFGKPTNEDFKKLYGKDVTFKEAKKGEFTLENTILEMKEYSLVMRFANFVIVTFLRFHLKLKKGETSPELRMMLSGSVDTPLRNLNINAGIKGGLFKGLLDIANGHFFKGLLKMLNIK